MLVTVKALQGQECSLQVCPQQQVRALKALVAERLQVPVSQQRILYRGRALADSEQLCAYGIGPGARLNLVLRAPKGGEGPAGLGAEPGPGGEGQSAPLATPPATPPPLFGGNLAQLLQKHFGVQDGARVLQQLQKDYEQSLRGMSLDDVERLGTRLLHPDHAHTEPGHAHTEPGCGYPEPGHAHTEPGHAHTEPGHAHTEPGCGYPEPGHAHAEPGHAHTEAGHACAELGHALSGYGHAYNDLG